ncbi:MAG: hypothetical protein Kow0074_12490 [Candidatus Zixiibacteriota bacterium]
MIGKTFGNYRILEKRGEGGMGMFFRAIDLHLDRIVGLKTLRPELLADPDLRERLHTEARSLARLVHQNIANVLHYLVEDDYHFIVMEFVDGKDLGEIIKESGPIPLDRLALIVPQICAAVSYAHQKNVIHRDLKPSNIMLTSAGEVKVTDFGIAKILGAQSQTRTGVAPGSLHYMAPEQISGGTIDQRSDVYQLGAMLYELYTGKKPFVSDNEYELMTMHLNEMPATPSAINDRVPAPLDPVILKALAKKPEDRYPSVRDLSVAFSTALKSVASSDVSDRTQYTPSMSHAPESPNHPMEDTARVEDATSYAPRPQPAGRPASDIQGEPPPPKRGGTAKLIMGLAGVGLIIVVGALWWLQRDRGADDSATTTETETAAAPLCTLTVVADIPADVRVSELQAIRLNLDHADSGQTAYDVAAPDNRIRETYIITPTTSVFVSIEGTDRDGNIVLSGSERLPASVGTAQTNIPLTYTPPKVVDERPAEPTHNLAISITPFTARQSVDRVLIDGRSIDPLGEFKYRVPPGKRFIRLEMGADRLTDTITVPSTGVVEKSLFIGSGRGRLSVGAIFPGEGGFADIWIDGVQQEGVGTPAVIDGLLEGPHLIEVRQEGYRARGGGRIVVIPSGGKSEISFEMVEQ